jgi:hypothetical protein
MLSFELWMPFIWDVIFHSFTFYLCMFLRGSGFHVSNTVKYCYLSIQSIYIFSLQNVIIFIWTISR